MRKPPSPAADRAGQKGGASRWYDTDRPLTINHNIGESIAPDNVNANHNLTHLHDAADQHALQLQARLSAISGEGFETFSRMNDELQENYLWAASTLADQLVRDMTARGRA